MMKKISKLSTGILISVFLILATYGVNLSWNTHSNGKMTNCPLMREMTQVCQMDIMQHITGWQKLFAAAFQFNTLQFLIVSFLALVAVFYPTYAFFTNQNQHKKQIAGSLHTYTYPLTDFYDRILRKRE